MLVSLFGMHIPTVSRPPRNQSRGVRREQLDVGIGDTFVSILAIPHALPHAIHTKVGAIPSSNCLAHHSLT